MRPKIFHENFTADGCQFCFHHKFHDNHVVPVYELRTTGALNQIIGHVKFLNSEYGNVYYRGITGLFDNVRPSLMRNRVNGSAHDLYLLLNSLHESDYFKESLKLQPLISGYGHKLENKRIKRFNHYKIESLLQHYAGNTRFLDVVDNHWVALWMGLHDFICHGKGKMYCMAQSRSLSMWDMHERILLGKQSDTNIYAYVLLIAMPYSTCEPYMGIVETDEYVEVDLRRALPSIYLRPHAQHALVVRKRDKGNDSHTADYYDMSSQVVAILRIRVDRVAEWLGNGRLLTQENLFPSPSIDQGYNNLLLNSKYFTDPFQIRKYF